MSRNTKYFYNVLVPRGLDWAVNVKVHAKLAVLLLKVVPLVFGQTTPSRVKVVWAFSRFCARFVRKQGSKGLAIYLKTSYVVLQQYVGGQKARSPWTLGTNIARTRLGIPRVVARVHRSLIRSGDPDCIRFWLTLLGLYRQVEFKGKLKLGTITAPGCVKADQVSEWQLFVPTFWVKMRKRTMAQWWDDWVLEIDHLLPIRKSSPNSQGLTAIIGLFLDLRAWADNLPMRGILKEWLHCTGNDGLSLSLEYMFSIIDRDLMKTWGGWGKELRPLGSLAFLREPGKVRVVALVDLVTQSIMKPLHDKIFSMLRLIPQDGTFNQAKPVEVLLKTLHPDQTVYSFDLSAATDRLPVVMQEALLACVIGDKLASLWRALLTTRRYRLPKEPLAANLGFNSVVYSVGQPMGALSSWAMLALTHHAIIQYCAWKAGLCPGDQWFKKYALLGDDIVIGDDAVAQAYLQLMDSWGVEISQAKSLVSRTMSLEFAKRTYVRGVDVSPISLAELVCGLKSITCLVELLGKVHLVKEVSLASILKMLGFGYRNLGKLTLSYVSGNRLQRLVSILTSPVGIRPSPFEVWTTAKWHGGSPLLDVEDVWDKFLDLFDERLWRISRVRETHFIYLTKWGLEWMRWMFRQSEGALKLLWPDGPSFPYPAKDKLEDPFDSLTPRGRPVIGQSLRSRHTPLEMSEFNQFLNNWIVHPAVDRVKREMITYKTPGRFDIKSRSFEVLGAVFVEGLKAFTSLNRLSTPLDWIRHEKPEFIRSDRIIRFFRDLRKAAPRVPRKR